MGANKAAGEVDKWLLYKLLFQHCSENFRLVVEACWCFWR